MESIQHCEADHCLTCADALLVVRVVALREGEGLALVEIDGQQEEVDISLVEQIAPGDVLLVHGGVALARQAAGSVASTVEQTM